MQTDFIFGRNAVEALLKGDAAVDTLYILNSMEKKSAAYFEALAKEKHAVIKRAPDVKMDALVGNTKHQGLIATMAQLEYLDLGDLEEMACGANDNVFLLLNEIADPHNLGALIRSAYLFGIKAVVITKRGGCSVTPTAIKASAGAALKMPIIRVSNMGETVRRLKENGVFVFAAQGGGEPLDRVDCTGKLALIMGSEGEGVSPLLKKLCDGIISVPLLSDDTIDSLNVSVAAGIILNKMNRLHV